MKLEECRNQIDAIDAEMLALLNRRATLSRKIGLVKIGAGLPIVDRGREQLVIGRAVQENPGEISSGAVLRIYREILRESREIQLALAAGVASNGERSR